MIVTKGYGSNLIITKGYGSSTVGFGRFTGGDIHSALARQKAERRRREAEELASLQVQERELQRRLAEERRVRAQERIQKRKESERLSRIREAAYAAEQERLELERRQLIEEANRLDVLIGERELFEMALHDREIVERDLEYIQHLEKKKREREAVIMMLLSQL